MATMSRQKVDLEAGRPIIRSSIADVLRKQADAGIDMIGDGELGKAGFGTEDRVRYTRDLPLRQVVDPMLRITAGAYSVEAADARHGHEWKIWQDVKLPEGKILIPGVAAHHSHVVEQPELVADRTMRYANLLGRENAIAGTGCGMGRRVHPRIAWAKLKVLAEGARLASQQ